MERILILLACHFLGDFPFQGDRLGCNKGKSWELMFYHCAIYSLTFALFGKVTPIFVLVLFVSHIIIDPLKARYGIIKEIYTDQLLHIAVIIICILIGL